MGLPETEFEGKEQSLCWAMLLAAGGGAGGGQGSTNSVEVTLTSAKSSDRHRPDLGTPSISVAQLGRTGHGMQCLWGDCLRISPSSAECGVVGSGREGSADQSRKRPGRGNLLQIKPRFDPALGGMRLCIAVYSMRSQTIVYYPKCNFSSVDAFDTEIRPPRPRQQKSGRKWSKRGTRKRLGRPANGVRDHAPSERFLGA
ncbi:hypothetical protein GGX14DRAFT_400384 [Mycena pura]|uniref:Uncharacterized protein n=1 Tax=Mycena pura TaxID=153505 RepID=A0AAD6Y5S2_9AGAR|nr:hypothetical protein GGX14DRAFT_400384 [Mycena pura]